jgi:Na+-translocating ferredoxin:NAD+ oxidoreductase RnfD subunit
MKKVPSLNIRLSRFLILYGLGLAVLQKDIAFVLMTLNAVFFAMMSDAFLAYIHKQKWEFTDSSLITGLIVAFVLASHQAWWLVSLASIFAICSKYIFTINQKHIFNPAAFGIFLVMVILGARVEWHGAFLWYIMIPGAIYFVLQAKRIEIVISYSVMYLILFGFKIYFDHTSFADILRYTNYFFILIMLDDPLTSPHGRFGKIIFGVSVALLVFIFYVMKLRYEFYLTALLVGNLFVPWLNSSTPKLRFRRR